MRKITGVGIALTVGFVSGGYAWNEGLGPFSAKNCPSVELGYSANPAQYNLEDVENSLEVIDFPFAGKDDEIRQFETIMSSQDTDSLPEVRGAFSALLAGVASVQYSYGDDIENEIFNRDDSADVQHYKAKILETAEQIVRLPAGLITNFILVEDLNLLPDNPTGVVLPEVKIDFGLFSVGTDDTPVIVIGDSSYPKLIHEFAHVKDFKTCSPSASPGADSEAESIFEVAEKQYSAGSQISDLAYSDYPFNTGDPVTGVLEYKAVAFEDLFYGQPYFPNTPRGYIRDLITARLNSWFTNGNDAFGPYFALLQYCGKPNADSDVVGPDEFLQKCLGVTG